MVAKLRYNITTKRLRGYDEGYGLEEVPGTSALQCYHTPCFSDAPRDLDSGALLVEKFVVLNGFWRDFCSGMQCFIFIETIAEGL